MGKPVKIYINLTNGLEFFEQKPELGADDVVFMRLQSTHCEQKRWEQVLSEVPDDMLFRLALGYKVIVVDFSGRRKVPRAIWQGMELLKYVLYRLWFDREYLPPTRAARDKGEYFQWVYGRIKENRNLRRRFEYFKRYLMTDDLDIEYITGHSSLDTKWERIYEIVRRLKERAFAGDG